MFWGQRPEMNSLFRLCPLSSSLSLPGSSHLTARRPHLLPPLLVSSRITLSHPMLLWCEISGLSGGLSVIQQLQSFPFTPDGCGASGQDEWFHFEITLSCPDEDRLPQRSLQSFSVLDSSHVAPTQHYKVSWPFTGLCKEIETLRQRRRRRRRRGEGRKPPGFQIPACLRLVPASKHTCSNYPVSSY